MVDNVCYLLIVFDLLQLFCVLFFPLSSLELIIIMNSILSPLLADLRQLLFRSSFQVYRIHLETIAEYFHVIFYHFSNSIRAFSSVAQSSLSITNSRSLLKLMSIESVMPSSHLILCRPLFLLPPIPPSISLFQ